MRTLVRITVCVFLLATISHADTLWSVHAYYYSYEQGKTITCDNSGFTGTSCSIIDDYGHSYNFTASGTTMGTVLMPMIDSGTPNAVFTLSITTSFGFSGPSSTYLDFRTLEWWPSGSYWLYASNALLFGGVPYNWGYWGGMLGSSSDRLLIPVDPGRLYPIDLTITFMASQAGRMDYDLNRVLGPIQAPEPAILSLFLSGFALLPAIAKKRCRRF